MGNPAQRTRISRPHGTQYCKGFTFDKQRDNAESIHRQIEAMKLAFVDGRSILPIRGL